MIEVHSLFSGSEGNCLLVRSGSTAVLMDAGRTRRAIQVRLATLGLSLADIAAIFITHEHTDHVSALYQLSRHEHIPVHGAGGCGAYLSESLVSGDCTVWHPPLFTEVVGSLTVTSFPLPHDARCHVGYLFRDEEGDAFCAATDMGEVTDAVLDALRHCRGALLEANHDVAMLKTGPYPPYLKARILSPLGHLSNEACASLAVRAAGFGVRRIALAHLSKENNTPAAALSAVRPAVPGVEVVVCDRSEVTRVM